MDSAEVEDSSFAAEAIVEDEIGEPRLLLRSDEETQSPRKNASDQAVDAQTTTRPLKRHRTQFFVSPSCYRCRR